MLLFTSQESERLKFTIDFLSQNFLNEELVITSNLDLFLAHEGLRINYSRRVIEDVFHVQPEGLLFEEDIRLDIPVFYSGNGLPILFKEDFLSGIFYYLTRYEEYQIADRDEHQRFLARFSIGAKEDILFKPIVDLWAIQLVNQIEEFYRVKISKHRSFSFLCTFDIDVAYAYKGRSFWRKKAVSIKNIFAGNSSFLTEQRKVLAGNISFKKISLASLS